MPQLSELGAENVLAFKRSAKRSCDHSWVVDEENRILECKLCGKEQTAWDFVVNLAYREDAERKRLQHLFEEASKLAQWAPRLRALRELERIWRGRMLPACPNCGVGVRAEDLARGSLVTNDMPELTKKRIYKIETPGST